MCAAGECLLDAAAVAKELAEPVPDRVCLLASRALMGMAREGALKLLESTAGRVAALPETFLGFRHGPMAFAGQRTILLFFLSSDERNRPYELDLLREARAKGLGRKSVALGPGAENVETDVRLSAPYAAPLPDCYRAPVDVIFPQMLAFFSCLQLGLQPDAPSAGGVIHRVVQGVRIYG
jgi:tagatose-6-phosphate ketose/aldose isomerase